jgi:hypothetical protein
MPREMARSDSRPNARVTRGAGSGQHLASVLQEGRENANIDEVWDSSGEYPFKSRDHFLSGQISPSYASTNRRGKCVTYRAVCGKRATLLDNAGRANRNPPCRLELNNGRNVKWPATRAWGNTTPEYWIDGLRIGMGFAYGLLRRRHSGKGRAVPERTPV